MSAIVAALESLIQFLSKKSESFFMIFLVIVTVWFVTSEWNGLKGRVSSLETRMDKVEVRLDKIEADIASLDKRLTVVEMKVDALTVKVDEMREDIKTILTILTTKKN